MSANLHRSSDQQRMEALAMSIESDLKRQPDFIVCQEVMFKDCGGADSSAEALARALGYNMRGDSRGMFSQEGSAIISRYPFTYYESRTLRSSPSRLLLGFRRMSAMGEFDVPGIGRVRVVGVHLQAGNPFTNGWKRAQQLRETLNWVADRDRVAPAAVTFLGGDFNAEPVARELNILDKPYRQFVFHDFNSMSPTKKAHESGTPKTRIDNIFVATASDRPVKLAQERVLWQDGVRQPDGTGTMQISDHCPLLHVYSFSSSLAGATSVTHADTREIGG